MLLTKPTILLIDDDTTIRTLYDTIMKHWGYKTIVAVNGVDGISKFKTNKDSIGLVLTDYDMPEANGGVVTNYVKSVSSVPVIIITGARYHLENIEKADIILEKPITLDELRLKIEEIKGRFCE